MSRANTADEVIRISCGNAWVGKLKTASSKRDVPLNQTAVAMVEDLRAESWFGARRKYDGA